MRDILQQLRRAPGRILASVLAMALAVAAMGVLAIPTVSESSLHEAADGQGLGDLVATTSPLDSATLADVRAIPGVARAEASIDVGVTVRAAHPGPADDAKALDVRVVGLDLADQQLDLLVLSDGRLPSAADEVVLSNSIVPIGADLQINGTRVTVVGHGGALWWLTEDAVYADLATAATWAPAGTNRLVLTAADDGEVSLRAIGDELRAVLDADGAALTQLPIYLPDGSTPIDADIRQVSTLIGLLGMVAGLVALVLLASTTSTLVAERTREVAVMRALGGRSRTLRRRLRRTAMWITVAALVVGLPLGIGVSNVIARMVVDKFVGITPDIGVDWRVLVASAAFMLIGARLVSARSARQIVNQPLAESLAIVRGRRSVVGGCSVLWPASAWVERLDSPGEPVHSVRCGPSRRCFRCLLRSGRRSSSPAWPAPSTASTPPRRRRGRGSRRHRPATPGCRSRLIWWLATRRPRPVCGPRLTSTIGTSISTGCRPTLAFSTNPSTPVSGCPAGRGDVVLSRGFADRRGIEIGDTIDVEAASGHIEYRVIGTTDDHGVAVYVDRDVLAADLDAPGMANLVWSSTERPAVQLPVASTTTTVQQMIEDDSAGRDAIVVIFGAIGGIVAGVAALAVASSMTVSLYRRRHELAALQSLGATRRTLRGVVLRELLPIGAVGLVLGLGLGALGTRGIIASFEASNAVDIGVVDATGAVPAIVLTTLVALLLLTRGVVRSAARRPIAVTLRGAA